MNMPWDEATTTGKVVIVRPGALGDVLVVRHLIRFLRARLRPERLVLVAPGERGRLFQRPGWADMVYDWERAAFSRLFVSGEEGAEPPALVHEVFGDAALTISFVGDAASPPGRTLAARLAEVAPRSRHVVCVPRPESGGEYVGMWMIQSVSSMLGLPACDPEDRDVCADRLVVEAAPPMDAGNGLLVHPGSGSRTKNWPLERYAELLERCRHPDTDTGRPLFDPVAVTSGEADGTIGERLAERFPGVIHIHDPLLERLVGLAAGARVYIGNDSGVSHLAASVRTPAGRYPKQVVLFGPSDPSVWSPPGARAVCGGDDFSRAGVGEVFEKVRQAALSG